MLTERDLQPADVICSTTDARISAVIRSATGASVSHCILYIGGSYVIEAIASGVERRPLANALREANLAVVLRRQNLTPAQARSVIAHAERFRHRPYDALGAAGAGVHTFRGLALGVVACRVMLPFCPVATAAGINNARPENADNAFFCSELVARCFELAGIPIVEGRATNAAPRHIRVATTLSYVGKLVDTPPPPRPDPGIAPGSPL